LLPYLYRLLAATSRCAIPADRKERAAAPLAALNFVLLIAAVAMPEPAPLLLAVSVTVVLISFCGSFWSLYRNGFSLP
jgi:hypothetical protein